ncbi:lipoprotein LpqH [Mycolicibacterium thermoresistibile]
MGNRRIVVGRRVVPVVALIAAVGVVAGCSQAPSALGGSTAEVTINGESTGGPHPVRCSQNGWAWTVQTPEQDNGFTAVFNTEGEIHAESVEINGLGDFTGSFWTDNVGRGRASVANGTFRVTGTAVGSYADNPTDTVDAEFAIEVDC